jgi:NDP-4-keto-2,6-dideoxyhexose 3-C-methyltransferase
MYKSIKKCRVCGGNQLTPIFSLGEQSLTGVFLASPYEKITTGPVDLVMCTSTDGCGLVQLLQSYEQDTMYGDNYGYRSGLNKSMVDHLHQHVQKILDMGILKSNDIVIDIGSNDATTLKSYPKGLYKLVGIDPTGNKFIKYYPSDIFLIPKYFSAEECLNSIGESKAKVITSFSMFYDLEDPVAFAKEIEKVLDDHGIWVMEQSYLPSMLQANSFDTICQEHLEYYCLMQIEWIMSNVGLKIIDVDFNNINGGSFVVYIAKKDSLYTPKMDKIEKVHMNESMLGVAKPELFASFNDRIKIAKDKMISFLENAKRTHKNVCGLGASTKGNVLLQYYGIDSSMINEIGEVNPDKYGKYTPGTGIVIKSEDEVLASNPDYIVILPWHFRKFFENLDKLKGRQIVYPLPSFEVVKMKE